jgi:hypothetical protein
VNSLSTPPDIINQVQYSAKAQGYFASAVHVPVSASRDRTNVTPGVGALTSRLLGEMDPRVMDESAFGAGTATETNEPYSPQDKQLEKKSLSMIRNPEWAEEEITWK